MKFTAETQREGKDKETGRQGDKERIQNYVIRALFFVLNSAISAPLR